MRQDNRYLLWEPEDHPSTELLRQYQEDALPPALSHELERHLLDCDLCSDVLEGMVVSDAGKTRAAVAHINRHITAKIRKKKRKPLPVYLTDWRVAAALLLVLCSTLLVFYYNYREISRQKQSMATESDKAVRESVDLGEAPAATRPETRTEAVPDTVKPAIAATTSPPARLRKNRVVSAPASGSQPQVRADQETAKAEQVQEEVAAAPAVASAAEVAVVAKPSLAIQESNAFVPESAAVAKALQGKVSGTSWKRSNASVAMKQVRGQVLSADGQPLPGVAVRVKGSSAGVATDGQGHFTLNLPVDKTTLAFSYIGYEHQEKTVEANTQQLTVNLQEDQKSLSEVVVVEAYGKTGDKAPKITAAKPASGSRAYRKYLEENIRYTASSPKGRVVVQATVAADGTLQNLRVAESLCQSCDEEALRLVKEGPAWKPATSNGTAVQRQVKIVVRFRPEPKK